ncbi:MAG: hypothetical protein A2V52_04390 [Actinobacteria bacterium RBG_19FT_COMBO_54_7]|nr:MAG: hypothetical protein A2V52_04390 [Actinobacteria bacterium RBG_19FT_COMBO_54_7]
MISSGDSNGKRRRGSRARKILLIAMMAVVGIILLTWTECGCTVEQKQGAAAEVAEEQSAGNQNTGSQSTNMSASETALDKARQAGASQFPFHAMLSLYRDRKTDQDS